MSIIIPRVHSRESSVPIQMHYGIYQIVGWANTRKDLLWRGWTHIGSTKI